MEEVKIQQLMMTLMPYIPEEASYSLKQSLQHTSDSRFDAIMYAEKYNPTHILLISIFLGVFGVDRFMIGDVGLGVGKLLLGWATCGIWPLIDIFCSYRKAKEKNLQKITMLL